MRKLLTLLFTLCTYFVFGQLQNFDSGTFPPSSPNNITTPVWSGGTWSGDPATWYRSDDLVVNGTSGNNGLDDGYDGTGNCAILYSNDWDGYKCCGFEVDMIINNIDMSTYTAPYMKFYIRHPDGDEQLEVAASNMGGSYTTLETINSNYLNWTLITVDLSAYAGSNDVYIRFRGKGNWQPGNTNIGIDEVLIENQTNMVYLSSTTSHVGCGLKQDFEDQEVMGIEVLTQGSLNPIDLQSFIMNTNGSTDDCSDVVAKNIYSTGSSSSFDTTFLIGSSDLTGDYSINNTVTLSEGVNYFWLACDISASSTISNVVDAECTGIVINGVTETPTITAPTGSLTINNTGIFPVTNLNDAGTGSLREAVTLAYAYNCGTAYVDATAISGTIYLSSNISYTANHDINIYGPGPYLLTVNGQGTVGFLQNSGDGWIGVSGFKIENCSGDAAVYGANGKKFDIDNCWFYNNTSRAIYMPNDPELNVSNTTFSNNSSSSDGGAVYVVNDYYAKFYNCTFYNNSSSDEGGALQAINGGGLSTSLIIENCTFSNNSCTTTNGGGALRFTNGSNSILNSTFDDNQSASVSQDVYGSLTMSYSHLSTSSGATVSGSNNILNVSANLIAIQNNGGSTPTCGLNIGSPLIDAGIANIELDQRGFCRPNTSDIGAFEYNAILDLTAPIPNISTLPNITDECSVSSLIYPTATDSCSSNVSVSNNACLPITTQGTTVVIWTYEDGNGNTSTQTQNVVLSDTITPVADISILTDVTSDCSVDSLVAPTATDNCSGALTGTSNATLPITIQGTTVITWTYDDGNGNTSTQTQNVVLSDSITPVADLTTLTDVSSVCSIDSLVAPTATDNCSGALTGTSNATLPITTQGTTVVTWTYDDGNGNTSTQTQNVVLSDSITPVSDVSILTDVTSDCSVDSLVAPTATDNCSGALTGISNATLPITTQGTTVVTWTYEDGNGNTSTQSQNVVLSDSIAPVADVASLTDVIECFGSIPSAPTATDNCTGVITGASNVTFPITTPGTTVVTWTYDDGIGNVTTQVQNVIVNTVNDSVTLAGTLLTANSLTATYQWLYCDSGYAAISNAINQTYTPISIGNYAVEVTENNCVDTSDCYLVYDFTAINELISDNVLIYPNPSKDGYFTIQVEGIVLNLILIDMTGRSIDVPFNFEEGIINASSLESGKYFVQIFTEEELFMKQIVILK